jgi:hypothetical protein
MTDHKAEIAQVHELMVITSVQGYCRCGQWGMATDGGLDRLRELHTEHTYTPALHPYPNGHTHPSFMGCYEVVPLCPKRVITPGGE